MSGEALYVEQWRGSALEASHGVAACVCTAEGEVVLEVGPPTETTWRSAAKPFQLEASLSCLPAELLAPLTRADLSLGAASHSGEPPHVTRVRALLAHFGLSETALRCGGHWPVHGPSAQQLMAAGVSDPLPIHNNCSGKHTFMLAAAHALGAPHGYLDPAHPLQQRIWALLDQRTLGGVRTAVVDGCGAPCFVVSLRGMATAWAQAALALDEPARFGQGDRLCDVMRAMRAEPWWMSGTGRLDWLLSTHSERPLVSKVGAEGLLCVALPPYGIAIKVLSGADTARPAAALAILERVAPGVLNPDALAECNQVRNVAGKLVGHRSARWGSEA
jgi:L-asparaginase II